MNCCLDPLDSVASSARRSLKSAETAKGKLFGNDCFSANIVSSINKMMFKDEKGDTMGLKPFLCEQKLGKEFISLTAGLRQSNCDS